MKYLILLLFSFNLSAQVIKIPPPDTIDTPISGVIKISSDVVYVDGSVAPDSISNLVLTPAGTSIALTWTDNSDNEDGFIIQRGAFGGSFTSIDTVTSASFNNTSLSYATGYKYNVIAYNDAGSATGVKDSTTTWTWPHTMSMSYYSINSPYITYTQAEKDTIEGRLSQGYIQTTFGPSGLNKTVCDFFMIFWNSNTSTALTTKTNTKTGETLRWNYGAGNIYSQNNLPANINTGIISVSSADGFTAWTRIDLSSNTFINNFPIGSRPTTLTQLFLNNNLFKGDWNNATISSGVISFYLYANSFTGGLPNITPHATNQLIYYSYSNVGFNSASNVTTFRKAQTQFRVDQCALPTAKIDELLHNMYLYWSVNSPTQNCTINLSGATMGIPTGGVSNTDIVALQGIWTAAGKTLTLTIRTS